MATAKEKLGGSKEDFEQDVQEIKETLKNEKWNTKRKIKYIIKKNQNKLVLLAVGIVFLYFMAFDGIEIPQWLYLVGLSMVVTGIVTYPLASKIAKMFIKDTRIPLLELPDDGFDVWKVPQERVGDFELTEGEIHETQTVSTKQRALELRRFNVVEEKGRKKLVGLGIWEGTFPNSDIKRTWSTVKAMRSALVPQARKGREYDMKMPFWIHQMENQAINDLIYQFEDGATYNGVDMHKSIKQEMGIEDELGLITDEAESNTKMKIQELNDNLEEMSKAMENGESND